MKNFLLLLVVGCFLFTGAGMADPRIEVTDDFCHVPFDPANDDNETFLANCGGAVTVENGIADGYGTVKKDNVPLRALPIRPGVGESSAEIRFDGDETGFTCTLVDSNGTQYQTAQWSVWTLAVQGTHPAMGQATYEVFCFNAPAVIE